MCPSCWILHVIAALKQAYPPYQSKLDKSLPSPPSGGGRYPTSLRQKRQDNGCGDGGGRTQYSDHPVKSAMATGNPNACNRMISWVGL